MHSPRETATEGNKAIETDCHCIVKGGYFVSFNALIVRDKQCSATTAIYKSSCI
jgi:hypothetical protein